MTTLAIMKARIADELARDDLTSQIAYAITDAITAYQDERFFFSESRALTFNTVASQEFYTSADASWIPTITKIDYIFVYEGNTPQQLMPMRPADMESAVTNATSLGVPSWYCYYNKTLRFYSIPDDVYVIRVGAATTVDAPASDAETDNAWMTSAERLIRSRAKLELALHVLKDPELAQTMSEAVTEALEQIRERTTNITQVGDGLVRSMPF